MTADEIRTKYLSFFRSAPRSHTVIPSAPLVPENDPTTLFNSAGMQPLVPYLLGEKHPQGTRLVNSQKAIRMQDICEVGDASHTTFFEMLGNWSLGDYFKKEQISWVWEFFTKELGLAEDRLFVTVCEGSAEVPKDEESEQIWKSLGVPAQRIMYYGIDKNWWSRSGEPTHMPAGEPGGPDSEVFFDFGQKHGFHEKSKYQSAVCHPNCQCGRFMEIGNSVFMQYVKRPGGILTELPYRNVDFGGGLERILAAVSDSPDIFTTNLFEPIVKILQDFSGKKYGTDDGVTRSMRIIADHLRAAVMILAEGIVPSNKEQGYALRRFIRRSVLYGRKLGMWEDWTYIRRISESVISLYKHEYPEVETNKEEIICQLTEEAERFSKTVERGLKEIEKQDTIDGRTAFFLYESYGFPWELTEEIAGERGITVDHSQFEREFIKHQERSRTAAAGMFRGGLADHSEQITKLHTATHLLHQALRTVLGDHVQQKGSNITNERLRFDFSHSEKLTDDQKAQIQALVNEKIRENLPVTFRIVDKQKAIKSGARSFFREKYADKVKVYQVGDKDSVFSHEICGGPHVSFTGQLGQFTIDKEESAGAGVRRIYASVSEKS